MDHQNSSIVLPAPIEPPSTIEQRTAYLQRRHRLSPALAAVIASLAYEVVPAWHGRRL